MVWLSVSECCLRQELWEARAFIFVDHTIRIRVAVGKAGLIRIDLDGREADKHEIKAEDYGLLHLYSQEWSVDIFQSHFCLRMIPCFLALPTRGIRRKKQRKWDMVRNSYQNSVLARRALPPPATHCCPTSTVRIGIWALHYC